MARQENLNLFALLGDEAEDSDDVSTLIESVVKVDPRVAAEEKRRKKKKNMEAEKPIGINLDVDSNNYKSNNNNNNNNIVVDMRAKPIVLPEHVTRRDIVVNKKQSDEQGQSRGSERFGPGGNGSQRNYGGADGYQRNNGGRNGYQRSNRGSDGYPPNNGGADGFQRNNGGRYNGGADGYQSNNGGRNGYQRSNRGSDGYQPNNEGGSGYNGNNGGENSFQRTEGADAVNAVGDGWQVQGRVRVSGGRGREGGRGRGRGRGRGFNEGHEFGSENQDVVSSYPSDKPGQDTNDGGSVEQNEFQGKVRKSEALSDERPRNVNWGTGGGRKGNGRGNHGFRGQDSRPYDRQSGPNNRRGEVSNDTEAKENRGGDIGTAVQVDNSAGAEWDIPVTTEEPKDADHEQGKLKAQDNSEKKAKHAADDDEEEKNMTLEEYEKVCFEKRKALESLRKAEQRTVTLDKDFESMQLVEKKKDDSLVIKPKSEEKLKKKNSLEKDEKARKSMNINEFLKPAVPARGGRGRGRGRERGGQGEFKGERGARGEFRGERGARGEFLGQRPQVEDVPAPSIEDPQQFPVLGGAIKA